jgi:hypothetical protein
LPTLAFEETLRVRYAFLSFLVVSYVFLPQQVRAADPLEAGFAEVDITPDLKAERPVWLAGYGQGRRATGVHDPIMARCMVLRHGAKKIALASVDLVGLQYPEVQLIRKSLADFTYVLVSSTHNHEGPDVIGIWGRTFVLSGLDPEYQKLVVTRVAEMVRAAEKRLGPVTAAYNTAEDESLLGDSRKPIVKDGVIRVLRFHSAGQKKPAGLFVQWNCHPEAMGSKNTLLTADFPWATVAALKKKYECPVVYVSGAVGGLMAPPRGRVKDADGKELNDGDFEYARVYGEEVASLAGKAIESAEPISLVPFAVSAAPLYLPVENSYYRAAQQIGVLPRESRVWTGDVDKVGEKLTPDKTDVKGAVESEVAYLRLGELHLAAIPGEIYPELVYGKYQEPVEPNVDFPTAELEPHVTGILPGKKWMLIGLANDEIGYIIPKRQWDSASPFAYDRTKSQYGEINSCGPEIAPLLMKALQNRVRTAR